MVNIYIQIKDYAWIAELNAIVKGVEHKKVLKGTFEKVSEIKDIILQTLKTNKDIEFYVNNMELESELVLSGWAVTWKDDLDFDFSEIIEYKEQNDPTIPEELNKRYQDICIYNEKELNDVAITTYFIRSYFFFKENPEKIKDIPLLNDLKSKGLYNKDILMEDILQTIEETFIK